ncbi:MAG: hypothetical protein QXY79_04315, partial [Candidatus Methanomethylicia archaeon]
SLLQENPKAIIQSLFSVVPYPGTEMYQIAIKNGFDPPTNLEGWANFTPENWISKIPWVNEKRRRDLKTLYFASIFIDEKINLTLSKNIKTTLLSSLAFFYRPVARYRLKKCGGRFQIEALFLDYLLR